MWTTFSLLTVLPCYMLKGKGGRDTGSAEAAGVQTHTSSTVSGSVSVSTCGFVL